MQFKDVLLSRHSVRYFEATPVAEAILRDIIDEATHAPSWVNAQQWHVWAAEGKTLESIRTEFYERVNAGLEGKSDIPPSHRDAFSPIGRENMQQFSKAREDAGLASIKLECDALFDAT